MISKKGIIIDPQTLMIRQIDHYFLVALNLQAIKRIHRANSLFLVNFKHFIDGIAKLKPYQAIHLNEGLLLTKQNFKAGNGDKSI